MMVAPNFINHDFFERLRTKMALLEKPTVGNAIDAMSEEGNEPYINGFPGLTRIEVPFTPASIEHEVSHISAKLGHTPQHEKWHVAFYEGLMHTPESLPLIKEKILTRCADQIENADKEYVTDARGRAKIPSDRTMAVYFAAGLYLRQKIDRFQELDFHDESYEDQRDFCQDYALTANDTVPHTSWNVRLERNYPYELIHISPEEWSEITKVALGLCPPDQSLYPNRLTAIKEALVTSELFYDLSSHRARLADKTVKTALDSGTLQL